MKKYIKGKPIWILLIPAFATMMVFTIYPAMKTDALEQILGQKFEQIVFQNQ